MTHTKFQRAFVRAAVLVTLAAHAVCVYKLWSLAS